MFIHIPRRLLPVEPHFKYFRENFEKNMFFKKLDFQSKKKTKPVHTISAVPIALPGHWRHMEELGSDTLTHLPVAPKYRSKTSASSMRNPTHSPNSIDGDSRYLVSTHSAR
jgi:hypothetical protein